MARPTYYELLKHPKWQAKRLEVMERAGFACEWCDDEETTLHVHHTYYTKGANPWEYPSAHLLCLCAACHERADYLRTDIARLAGIAASRSEDAAERIAGYASALLAQLDPEDEPSAGWVEIESSGEASGVADFFGVTEAVILSSLDGNGADYSFLRGLDPRRRRVPHG